MAIRASDSRAGTLKLPAILSTLRLMIAALAVLLPACAAQRLQRSDPFPPNTGLLRAAVDPLRHEMANHLYTQISSSPVYVFTAGAKTANPQQPGVAQTTIALLSGAAAHREAAARYIEGTPALSIELADLLRSALQDRVAAGTSGKLQLAPAPRELVLSPAALLATRDSVDSRLYLVVWATLQDVKEDKSVWSSRYIVDTCQLLPVFGANGWASMDWKPLRTALESASKSVADIIIRDTQGPASWTGTPIEFQAPLYPLGLDFPARGEMLREDTAMVTVRLRSTLDYGGVNIVCRKDMKPLSRK